MNTTHETKKTILKGHTSFETAYKNWLASDANILEEEAI